MTSPFSLEGKTALVTGGNQGLGKVFALEWAPDGIRVNAVAPGYVKTEMARWTVRNSSAIGSTTGLSATALRAPRGDRG